MSSPLDLTVPLSNPHLRVLPAAFAALGVALGDEFLSANEYGGADFGYMHDPVEQMQGVRRKLDLDDLEMPDVGLGHVDVRVPFGSNEHMLQFAIRENPDRSSDQRFWFTNGLFYFCSDLLYRVYWHRHGLGVVLRYHTNGGIRYYGSNEVDRYQYSFAESADFLAWRERWGPSHDELYEASKAPALTG